LAVFFFIAVAIVVWGGLRVWQGLFKLTGRPLPWVENYWTLKWPMLVFNVWTITISLGFVLPSLFSR
jgi:hypothetical protein